MRNTTISGVGWRVSGSGSGPPDALPTRRQIESMLGSAAGRELRALLVPAGPAAVAILDETLGYLRANPPGAVLDVYFPAEASTAERVHAPSGVRLRPVLHRPSSAIRPRSSAPTELAGLDWGRSDLPSDTSLGALTECREEGASFVVLSANLLSTAATRDFVHRVEEAGMTPVLTDPFAAGLLNGARAALGPVESGPSSRPPSVETLKSEWGRVVALGFLTAGHRRTLAVAAVQYLFALARSPLVVVEARTPQELRIMDELASAPALSPAERARIFEVADGRDRRSGRTALK